MNLDQPASEGATGSGFTLPATPTLHFIHSPDSQINLPKFRTIIAKIIVFDLVLPVHNLLKKMYPLLKIV